MPAGVRLPLLFGGGRVHALPPTASGTNLLLSPHDFVYLCRLQVLSPDGRCRTFDQSAAGYGRAEGTCVLVLRHGAPESASDVWLAGAAVNQDGRSASPTAPSGRAQQDVVRTALRQASVEGDQVPRMWQDLGAQGAYGGSGTAEDRRRRGGGSPPQSTFGPTEGRNVQWREANRPKASEPTPGPRIPPPPPGPRFHSRKK